MKKVRRICCAALFCAALFAWPAFGVGISQVTYNVSIYATDEEAARIGEIVATGNSELSNSLRSFGIFLKLDSIMPVYRTSLYDYAQTGEFHMAPLLMEGGQQYMSQVVDGLGHYAGDMVFTVDGSASDMYIYNPLTDRMLSADFRANADRVHALLERLDFDGSDFDAKLAFVDGLGYVYYLQSGTREVFIASGFKGANGSVFTEENGGIVAVDDQFGELANAELDRRRAGQAYLDSLPEGENPITGGNMPPAFIVDNTPYMMAGPAPSPEWDLGWLDAELNSHRESYLVLDANDSQVLYVIREIPREAWRTNVYLVSQRGPDLIARRLELYDYRAEELVWSLTLENDTMDCQSGKIWGDGAVYMLERDPRYDLFTTCYQVHFYQGGETRQVWEGMRHIGGIQYKEHDGQLAFSCEEVTRLGPKWRGQDVDLDSEARLYLVGEDGAVRRIEIVN